MSVFRFGAPASCSTPIPKRMKGSSGESYTPNVAFSTSPSMLQDITLEKSDMVMRNTTSGLTMKEYEEQMKKLTAENFNLKLRIYFVEERLSKVKGISDKEDLVKKIIELQVACESKSKELERKQELIYEASKALDSLQLEHEEQIKNLKKEKNKEILELKNRIEELEGKVKQDTTDNSSTPVTEDYEKQIFDLQKELNDERENVKELRETIKENHLDFESYIAKTEKLEFEAEKRLLKISDLSNELDKKEQELMTINFRTQKLEDEVESKKREEEIMKERLEEKNKTIDSLKASLSARDSTINFLEAKLTKERCALQSIQAKFDSLNFQNNRLKAEVEMLHSRLKRCSDISGKNKDSADENIYKQKYEEFARAVEEREELYLKQKRELEEKCVEKEKELQEYKQLCIKNKKLEDDHRKACAALRNFIKRSTDEKKERENLKNALRAREEELQELKSKMDKNWNVSSSSELMIDNKSSLAETGDNEHHVRSDTKICCGDKEKQIQLMLSDLEKKETLIDTYEKKMLTCKCGVEEKMTGFHELEAEILILKYQLEDKNNEDPATEELHNELEIKECEIERLNNELQKRNYNLQELINKELWDKNRQIEKLEKRFNLLSEKKEIEICELNQQILARDQQLKILQQKVEDVGITVNMPCYLLQGNKSSLATINREFPESRDCSREHINKLKSMLVDSLNEKKYLCRKVEELTEKLKNTPERDCGSKTVNNLKVECAKAKEELLKSEVFRREAAEVCTLLTLRLEELAGFLDSLLTSRELLNGIGMKRSQDIKQAVEKSRELSKHLTQSLINKSCEYSTLTLQPDEESFADSLAVKISDISKSMESFGITIHRDKVIAEQSAIIIRLREQLQMLNEEIKQRDIEISHCQANQSNWSNSQASEICKNFINVSTQVSEVYDEKKKAETTECSRFEKQYQKTYAFFESKRRNSLIQMQEASESEAWSEPDRSVSLARMGHLEDGVLNTTIRCSKFDDSTEGSSEETLNENSRSGVKRSRSAESEIRRLQQRIKILDETNDNLRKELNALKVGPVEFQLKRKIQKNEEVDLTEILNMTVSRLDESRMTCKELEAKLSEALQNSNISALQLQKANNSIAALEEEIKQMKSELESKTLESNQKSEKIEELKIKLEEVHLENELRLIEAIKQKEAAERKTLEVECRLKDAENMSKEVESKVFEMEKKINETKKFRKETVLQFKEAERNVDTAEKIMEEAERMKQDAEKKSRDFQNYVDVMRKEVEDRIKEAEKRVKRSEKERDEMEKQLTKIKKKLIEAEKNKAEVEMKVKEGKETIQGMEEKLRELEVAMDQCNEEAQRRIKDIQKKADAKVKELEHQVQEREWMRKNEAGKKILEAEKISRELEIGLKTQLEDAEKRIKEAKDHADFTVKKMEEEYRKQEAELRQKIADSEKEKEAMCADLTRQLDKIRVEASEYELELTRITNEKIHLEEELKRMLDKESAMIKDNKEIKGKYEKAIYELENKLSKLSMNKSELASRLEEIEFTNIDLLSRISAIRGKESVTVEHEFGQLSSSPPVIPENMLSHLLMGVDFRAPEINGNDQYENQISCDPNEQLIFGGGQSMEAYAPPQRNMNSSPDLGIESDPGRFSSLEAQHHLNVDPILFSGKREESEIKRLESENAELRRKLAKTRQTLEETVAQLSAANQRKKQIERAICKQLHKTHDVLKKAQINFESQDSDYIE